MHIDFSQTLIIQKTHAVQMPSIYHPIHVFICFLIKIDSLNDFPHDLYIMA